AAAGLASRTNTLFSVPMLFFMGASSHFPHTFSALALIVALAVILVLEFNGAYPALAKFSFMKKLPAAGKLGPCASITGVIHSGLGLTVILFLILQFL
ncbi:MAG: antitermination protein NusG, partial [Gammaproteobacteria bacterium]